MARDLTDTYITVYRFGNAFSRALIILAGVLSVALLLGSPASADEPAPRAVPAARAYPRAFASYDALVVYAAGVAADQSALDERRAASLTERDALAAALSDLTATRGGRASDPHASRGTRPLITTVRARMSEIAATDRELVTAGALTSPDTGWRMPTVGRITQPFGPSRLGLEPPRVYGGVAYAHFHEGVDIAGAWSAPVVAPARGRVVFAGLMGDGAMVVVLVHDGGLVSLYAHLDGRASPPSVRAGDEVAAGQRIGTVGMTGIVTGAHLHWAVWRDGALVDPLSLIRR